MIKGFSFNGTEIFTAKTHQEASDKACINLPCVTYDAGSAWPYTGWYPCNGCIKAIGSPERTFEDAVAVARRPSK